MLDTCVTNIHWMDSQLTVVLKYGVFLISSLLLVLEIEVYQFFFPHLILHGALLLLISLL